MHPPLPEQTDRIVHVLTLSLTAMLFSIDQERPRLVPVTLRGAEQPDGSVDWTPRLQSLVGHESEVSSMIITKGVGGSSVRLDP